jgi:hypothetical protein
MLFNILFIIESITIYYSLLTIVMDIKKDSIDSQHLSYKSTTISPQIMEADD